MKARFDGKNLQPERPLGLPPGTIVDLDIEYPRPAVSRSPNPDVEKMAAKAESAADSALRMRKGDVAVEKSLAKRSSDEVSSSG